MEIKNVLLLVVMVLLLSCDKCKDDCKPSTIVNIKVIDTNGKNLFAQPDPVLLFEYLEIIAVYPNYTLSMPFEKDGEPIITFYPGSTDVYVIKYSFEESDTLIFKNRVFEKDECCSIVKNYDLEVNHQPYGTVRKDEIITIVK